MVLMVKRIINSVLSLFFLLFSLNAASQNNQDYITFNSFSNQYFGEKIEPLRKEYSGSNFRFVSENNWSHVSENSIAFSFETNLPSRSFVRYGISSQNLVNQTEPHNRYTSLHLHHISNLTSGQKIFYQAVAIDEDGVQHLDMIREATPNIIPNAIYIDNTASKPIIINTPGYYVLKESIISQTRGVTLRASNVTLDLNGHTLTYDTGAPLVNGQWNDYVYSDDSTFGVMVNSSGNWSIINGSIIQSSDSPGAGHIGHGFNPIYGSGSNALVRGVKTIYYGADVSGINVRYGSVAVRNCIVEDRGEVVTNRHQGIKGIFAALGEVTQNLILRTRHQGVIGGGRIVGNEIYVDSYGTNSFGVQVSNSSNEKDVHKNKIFGTGYHVVAVGWTSGLKAIDNYIQLVGLERSTRSNEYGAHLSLNGFRLTQYSGSTVPYEDMEYRGNIVSIHITSEGNQARGIQLSSDPHVRNIVVENNIFRVNVLNLDNDSSINSVNKDFAPIVTHGLSDRVDQTNPILYRDNTVMSNYRLFSIGDSYLGGSSNHWFIRTKLIREGLSSKFLPIRIGWWVWHTKNNRFLSSSFVGEIEREDARFYGSLSAHQSYQIGDVMYLRFSNCNGNPLVDRSYSINSNEEILFTAYSNSLGDTEAQLIKELIQGNSGLPLGSKTTYPSHIIKVDGMKDVDIDDHMITMSSNPLLPYTLYFSDSGELCANIPDAPTNLRIVNQ